MKGLGKEDEAHTYTRYRALKECRSEEISEPNGCEGSIIISQAGDSDELIFIKLRNRWEKYEQSAMWLFGYGSRVLRVHPHLELHEFTRSVPSVHPHLRMSSYSTAILLSPYWMYQPAPPKLSLLSGILSRSKALTLTKGASATKSSAETFLSHKAGSENRHVFFNS